MPELQDLFGLEGPLAQSLAGYRVRHEQLELAQAIQQAIQTSQSLIAEAGTGTGKTFAYLVPALLSGGKVILSTGTKTLQDQLFLRDIPLLRRLLNVPVTVALLKGRSNYLCHHHLQQLRLEGRFPDREWVHQLVLIQAFSQATQSGDISELGQISEQAAIWSRVTSTRDDCLGTLCAYHEQCFVLAARRKALQADVVVVNHHLFFADVLLQDEGAGELLPQCQTVILDEAHQIPETARLFFGQALSTTQILDFARDTLKAYVEAVLERDVMEPLLTALEKAARDVRLSVALREGRLSQAQLQQQPDFSPALDHLALALEAVYEQLQQDEVRAEAVQAVALRAQGLCQTLRHWQGSPSTQMQVRWAECHTQSLQLNLTPLDLGQLLQAQWSKRERSWIFLSATLSMKGDFSHFQQEMGLEQVPGRCWESPFDYAQQGLLYIPEGLALPNTAAFTESVVQAALPVLQASGGRAFMLFTSHRALRQAHALLHAHFQEQRWEYPLLVQGEQSRTELLQRFRQAGNAVLLGTGSFWEGVDIRGEALSLVIIDKIPFAAPEDPVLAARLESLEQQGKNPFMVHQLPRAVISLKQGAGRLIRDEGDRGVLMICDRRLLDKPYGRRIWMSLPPMRRSRSLQEVVKFFQHSAAQ